MLSTISAAKSLLYVPVLKKLERRECSQPRRVFRPKGQGFDSTQIDAAASDEIQKPAINPREAWDRMKIRV